MSRTGEPSLNYSDWVIVDSIGILSWLELGQPKRIQIPTSRDDKRKILNHQLYKEFELFYYIDTLSPDDQLFFTKMHGYNIENNCKHYYKLCKILLLYWQYVQLLLDYV